MNQVKSVLAILKKFGINVPPEALLAIGVLFAVVGALVAFVIARRKKAPKAPAADEGPTAVVAPAPAPPADRLLKVWRGFLKALPSAYRRSIVRFQPFVVLGASGSGKSALVDRFTDWQRQSNQFLQSTVHDPNLQIYLASRALVFELPAPLLLDTSSNAREALLLLFKRLLRRRQPVVVVPVAAHALLRSQPDELQRLADTIRGKINLLAQLHGAPIEVRVALTHADDIRGFKQFARFAERHGVSTALTLEPGLHKDEVTPALLRRFADYERLASLGLTTLPADDYLEVTAFLQDAPRVLSLVGGFVGSLIARDSLSHQPRLERVYLTCAPESQETSSPFTIPTVAEQALPNPLAKHRWAAAGIAALAACYFAVGYSREAALWETARVAALKYPDRLPPEQDALRRKLRHFQERRPRDPLLSWFPSFFSHVDDQLDDLIAGVTRKRTLLPELERSLGSEWASRKSAYLLAVLYAARDNALGALVRSNADHWALATGLEAALIEDYVAVTRTAYDEPPPLTRLPTVMTANATNDPQRWSLFFRRVARAVAQGPVSPVELNALQAEAEELQMALEVIGRFEGAAGALKLTDEQTGMGLARPYEPLMRELRAPEMFGSTRPAVERFLDMVRSGSLSAPAHPSTLLVDLGTQLSVLVEEDSSPNDEVLSITLGDESHTFRAAEWRSAIRTSTARELVLDFVRRASESDASIFFQKDVRGEPVLMNARNNGSYLFTGKGSLRPAYTRAAFDRDVRPVLTEFFELRLRLGLAREDLELLDDFVTQAVEEYATEYADAVDAFYRSYGVHADSTDSLQILIKQMLKPGSPFAELLRVVGTNTRLELDDERIIFFKPMSEAMARFAPLHRVVHEQEGGYSELEKYKAVLEQLLLGLRPEGAAASLAPEAAGAGAKAGPPPGGGAPGATPMATKGAAPAATATAPEGIASNANEIFDDLLSPAGRLGLAIFREEQGSYRALVQDWVTSMGLSADLARPFTAPVEQLERLGAKEIDAVLGDVWHHRLLVELVPITHAFPFDRTATNDATPEQIQALFQPQTGRFHDLTRRYIDPVLPITSDRSRGAAVRAPAGMSDVLRRVTRLTQLLWNDEGKVTPLRLRVSSVPFAASDSKKGLLTLAYLSTGTSSMFNFNQQPFITGLDIDWTRPQRAQLGIEIMNPLTGEKSYPSPLFAEDSPWSLLRLLTKGTPESDEVAWSFQVGRTAEETAIVRFKLHDDPWELFSLPTQADRRRASLAPGSSTTTVALREGVPPTR